MKKRLPRRAVLKGSAAATAAAGLPAVAMVMADTSGLSPTIAELNSKWLAAWEAFNKPYQVLLEKLAAGTISGDVPKRQHCKTCKRSITLQIDCFPKAATALNGINKFQELAAMRAEWPGTCWLNAGRSEPQGSVKLSKEKG